MSAPIARRGISIEAERDRLGHDRDQQRALGMGRRGDRAQDRTGIAEHVGILDDDTAGPHRRSGNQRRHCLHRPAIAGRDLRELIAGELRHGARRLAT
jgi:hypothetical protein